MTLHFCIKSTISIVVIVVVVVVASCLMKFWSFLTIVCFMSECQNYWSLSNADRNIIYGRPNRQCDSGIGPGWFRFEGSAGTRMPTSCPPVQRCNTDAAGWLKGGHPTVADGRVRRWVCFHYGNNCCHWARNIKVRNIKERKKRKKRKNRT